MKVGDLVKSVDWTIGGPGHKLGLIMEVDPDGYDAQEEHSSCFVQWVGDADWEFLHEQDFEVISENR